jgi:hypothetical protein
VTRHRPPSPGSAATATATLLRGPAPCLTRESFHSLFGWLQGSRRWERGGSLQPNDSGTSLTGIVPSSHTEYALTVSSSAMLGLYAYAYARWQLPYHTSTCNTSSQLVHESPNVPRAAVRVRHLYCSMNAIARKLNRTIFKSRVCAWDWAFGFHLNQQQEREKERASSVKGHLTELRAWLIIKSSAWL